MQAIPPYCVEIKKRVLVVEWRGHRVLLQEIDKPRMLIDAEFDSFQADIDGSIAYEAKRSEGAPRNQKEARSTRVRATKSTGGDK